MPTPGRMATLEDPIIESPVPATAISDFRKQYFASVFHGHGGLNCALIHFLRNNTFVLESVSLFSTS